MNEDEKTKEEKKDNNEDSGESEHSSEASSASQREEHPVYLDEIIIQNVEKTISETKNAKLPPVEDMRMMIDAYEKIDSIRKKRKKKSVKKGNDNSSDDK